MPVYQIHKAGKKAHSSLPAPQDQRVVLANEVKTFLDRIVEEPIPAHFSLSERVSEACGLNYSYLSSTFSKSQGISISGYFKLARLNMAKQLLTDRRLTVTTIAMRLGFSNAPHFCNQFKEHTGKTPGQYRPPVSIVSSTTKRRSLAQEHMMTRKILMAALHMCTDMQQEEISLLKKIIVQGKKATEKVSQRNLSPELTDHFLIRSVQRVLNNLNSISERNKAIQKEKLRHNHTIRKLLKLQNAFDQIEGIPPGVGKILIQPIEQLGFSARLQNNLRGLVIHDVQDLLCITKREFLSRRGCGMRSIAEIERFFAQHGLTWGMLPPFRNTTNPNTHENLLL